MMSIRGSIKPGLVLLTAGALVLIGGAFAGVRYTSQSSFCGSCHEMQPLHKGWKKGVHASTDCYDCHVDNTLMGHVKAKANGLRQVYQHFTADKIDLEKVSTHVPDARCVRCHKMDDQAKFGERVVVAHRKHGEAKIDCTVCHLSSGHSREVFVGFTQASCKECHSAERAPDAPSYLHRVACDRVE